MSHLAQRPRLEVPTGYRIEHGDAGTADQRDQQHQSPIHFQQLVGERQRALGGGIGTGRHQPPTFGRTGWVLLCFLGGPAAADVTG